MVTRFLIPAPVGSLVVAGCLQAEIRAGNLRPMATGNLYVADTGNHRIRKIDP